MPALGSDSDTRKLAHALLAAFEHRHKLAQMLRLRLGRELSHEALAGADLAGLVKAQIGVAEREQWTTDLIEAARAANPGSVELRDLAADLGLAAAPPPDVGFEAIVAPSSGFHDFTTWSRGLAEIEGRVCRVELEERALGTGFLVAEALVMTNWHVVSKIIANPDLRAHMRLRFDYKRLPSGATAHPGTEFFLADDWLLDHSPSPPVAAPGAPPLDELDYAVLRVRPDRDGTPVGRSRVGGPDAHAAAQRGWLSAPRQEHEFAAKQGLMIVQHPSGDPLQLAFEADAELRVNKNGTRIRYCTNTLPGSSGSPCFNTRMQLVALHHGGDPAHPDYASYNQGIPIARISDLLRSRGHTEVLRPPALAPGPGELTSIVSRARSRHQKTDGNKAGAWYSEPDEPQRAYLVGRGGFVDRAPLRASLRDMNGEYDEKILCIVGQPQSGKSFSWFLLEHFARQSDADAIKIDMRRWSDGATPVDIAAHIAPTLDIDLDIDARTDLASGYDRHAQATRQRMQVGRWLIGKLKARGRRCWLFFDHIDVDTIRPETRELLLDLSRAADDREADLRIVLVGLGQDQLGESLRYAAREDRPCGVSLGDVKSYLIELGRHLGVALTAEQASESAELIYAEGTVAHLRVLPRQVRRVARTLFAEDNA